MHKNSCKIVFSSRSFTQRRKCIVNRQKTFPGSSVRHERNSPSRATSTAIILTLMHHSMNRPIDLSLEPSHVSFTRKCDGSFCSRTVPGNGNRRNPQGFRTSQLQFSSVSNTSCVCSLNAFWETEFHKNASRRNVEVFRNLGLAFGAVIYLWWSAGSDRSRRCWSSWLRFHSLRLASCRAYADGALSSQQPR